MGYRLVEKENKEKSFIVIREMATRWKPSLDGGKWPMWIKIGSGVHGDGQTEHGTDHAHFKSKDGKDSGVFSIKQETPPKTIEEIVVLAGNIPTKYKGFIVEWANAKSKSYPERTNWYVAKDDWEANRGD